MSTAKNDITNDLIKTKPATNKYYENYDKIFSKQENLNEKNKIYVGDFVNTDINNIKSTKQRI